MYSNLTELLLESLWKSVILIVIQGRLFGTYRSISTSTGSQCFMNQCMKSAVDAVCRYILYMLIRVRRKSTMQLI